MELTAGLTFLVPSYLSFLLLFGFLVCGVCLLYSRAHSREQLAAKTGSETSRQHKLRKIQKHTVLKGKENFTMDSHEDILTHISELPMGLIQEYVCWKMNKNNEQIYQHLRRIRSTMRRLESYMNQDTHKVKITPAALLQIIRSMGVIPESHSKVIESVGFFPQPLTQAVKPRKAMKTASVTPNPPNQVHESVEVIPKTQPQVMEPKRMASRLNQATHSVKITPAALLQVMDSMGAIDKSHPYTVESVKMTSRSQYQAVKPVNTLLNLQNITSGRMHPMSQYTITKTVKMTSESKHKGTMSMTSGSQSQAMEQVKTTPELIHQNTKSLEMMSEPLYQFADNMKVTPVALAQAMDFKGMSPAQPCITESRSLLPNSQSQTANLTLEPISSHGLLSSPSSPTAIASLRVAESVSLPSESPLEIMKSAGMSSTKVNQITLGLPMGVIPEPKLQVVESQSLVPQPISQGKECLRSTSGLNIQGLDHGGTAPPCHQGTESVSVPSELFHRVTDPSRLTPRYKILEYSEISSKQSHTDTKNSQMMEHLLISETQVQSIKYGEWIPGAHLQAGKYVEYNPEPNHHVTEPTGLTPWHQTSESVGMISEPRYQETVAKFIPYTCHQVEGSVGWTPSSLGITPVPQSQTSQSVKMSLTSLQNTLETMLPFRKVIGEPPESQYMVKESLDLAPGSEEQSVKSGVPTPESQTEGVKFMELHPRPCLQDVKFSDLITELKRQDLNTGAQLQDTKSLGFVTESSSQFNQRQHVKDMKSVLTSEGPNFHSMKPVTLISEVQFQDMKLEKINQGLQKRDINLSELTSGPKLQGVKSEEQIHGGNSVETAPELRLHDSNLQMSSGLQDMKQVGLNSGTRLQDVKISNLTSGTQPQGIKSSELSSRPQLQCGNFLKLTPQPERQQHKTELLVSKPLLQDVKYVTVNQMPSFKGEISYKLVSESQVPNVESMESRTGTDLPSVNHSELTRIQQLQGVKSSGLTQRSHLEDMKSVEKTSVSKLQDLKSEKLTSELQPEDMVSEELTPRAQLGGIKPMQLTPKPEPQEVKSVLMSLRTQAVSIKPGQLTAGSQLQSLKSELTLSGTQLEDKKSVVLALRPCPKGNKSMETTPKPQLEGVKSMRLTPGPKIQGLKTEQLVPDVQVPDVKVIKLEVGPKMQDENSMAFTPGTLLQGIKSMEVLPGLPLQGEKPEKLTSEPQKQNMKLVELIPYIKLQSLKSVEETLDPQLQCKKSLKLAPRTKRQKVKSGNVTRRQGFQGIKSVDLDPKQQFQGTVPVDLTLGPKQDGQISVNPQAWKCVDLEQLKRGFESESTVSLELVPEPKSKGIKSVELKPKLQLKVLKSSELTPEPVIQDVKSMAFKCESQLQNMKSTKLTPGPQLYQGQPLKSTLKPQLQHMKIVELNKEPQPTTMRSFQWIRRHELQDVNSVRLNLESQCQCFKPSELKPSIQSGGVKSPELTQRLQCQGAKSIEFHVVSHLQCVKTSKLSLQQGLQNRKVFTSTSGSQLQGMKTVELTKKPQLGGKNSVDYVPEPVFQDTKYVFQDMNKLNLRSQSQGATPTKLNHSVKLGSVKSSELILGPNFQGAKSMKFDLGSQVQNMKISKLSFPGSELQKGNKFASTSEVQLQRRKVEELHKRPQLGSRKSLQWIPGPEFQIKRPVLSHRSQSLGITMVEVKPSTRLRNVKTSELTTRPQLQCMRPLASLQEHLSQRFKPIDLKSGLEFRSRKSYDLTIRSKLCDTKSITFKPQLHLQNVKPPELTPELVLQERKPLESSHGTHFQGMRSIAFMQKPSLPGAKPKILSQRPRSQSDKIGELDSLVHLQRMKSSEFAFQTKPQEIKFKVLNSRPQWQSAKCSQLTPEAKSQFMKCIQFSPSSQLKGVTLADFTMGTKVQGVRSSDFKPEQQIQGVKPSGLIPRTKHQEMKLLEFNSGPWLQNVKSSRLIMGTKLQDVKSVDFSSKPHSKGVIPSVMVQGENIQGVKCGQFKSSPELQGGKSDLILRSNIPHMKAAGLRTGPQLQDMKSSDMIMGIHLQGVKSKEFGSGQHLKRIKSSEVAPETKPQGMKILDLNCELQIESKKSCELIQGTKFQDVKSVEFNSGPNLQDVMSELMPEKKPEGGESMKCSSGPQLEDVKYSRPILGTEFQDLKPVQSGFRPHLQGMKSDTIPRSKPQTEKSMGVKPQPLWQDGRSFQLTLNKVKEKKSLRSNSVPPLYNRKLSVLSLGIHLPGMKAMEFSPMAKLQDVKRDPINLPTMYTTEVNNGSDWRVTKISKLALEPKFCSVVPSEFKTGNQQQEKKSRKSNQWPQSKSVKGVVFNSGSHLQYIKSSEICLGPTPHIKSMKLNSEQLQDVKSSELCLGKKFLDMNSGSKLEGTKPLKLCTETVLPEKQSLKFKHESKLQGGKSSKLNPGTQIWHKNDVALNTGSQLQSVNSPASILGPNAQCVNSTGYNSRPYLQGVNSASNSGPNPQCENSTGCHPEPCLQGLNFSAGTPEQCGNSSGYSPGFHLQSMNSAYTLEQQSQNVNSIGSSPETYLQGVNSCTCMSVPKLDQITESAKSQLQVTQSVEMMPVFPFKVCESVKVTTRPQTQVMKSGPISEMSEYVELTPNFSEFPFSPWLQNVKSKKLVMEPKHQILDIMELTGFQIVKTVLIPQPLFQVVNSEELAPRPISQVVEPIGAAIESEIEIMGSLDLLPKPQLQELVNSVELTLKPNIQVKSEELTSQQTPSFEEPEILMLKQRLQPVKSREIGKEPPEVMEYEDSNQGEKCQNGDSKELTSGEELQINYSSVFLHSPSTPLISNSVKTNGLGGLQDSRMLEALADLDMRNIETDNLQPKESCRDPIMTQSSAFSSSLYNQSPSKTVKNVENTHPEIPGVDVISKKIPKRKQVKELEGSLQSSSRHTLQSRRSPPRKFQAGFRTQRSLIWSFPGRQQNVWENHAYRQRLPRKYLSTVLMLGNVLGTTMERKVYSRTCLAKRAPADICQFIQNLFGIPVELMKFSQSLIEKGPGPVSQASVFKNYIQRHIVWHNYEKRTLLRMWTRGFTSSIMQKYSGTRLGTKKTNSNLSNLSQAGSQHMPVPCTQAQVPNLEKPETSKIFQNTEDSTFMEDSENSQSDSQTRTFEPQNSLQSSYLSQANNDFSEKSHLLQDLQIKIAARLIRSQIPPHMPPPLASGLVLKYPICLQCGQCSGLNCGHELQKTSESHLLIYPKLHLGSTPEDHGKIQVYPGFRLRIRKRPQDSKYHEKDRHHTIPRSPKSSSQRKSKNYTLASRSQSPTVDFQSGSSQSPAPPVQVYKWRRKWNNRDLVRKTKIGKSRHYEPPQVHSLSESDYESNQDGKWAKRKTKKTCYSKYAMRRPTKGLRTQNKKSYRNSRTTIEHTYSEVPPTFLRRKRTETAQASATSLSKQSKKSSQHKFTQLLFQGLTQAFQKAHRIISFGGQKSEERTRPANLWLSTNYNSKQKCRDYCLPRDNNKEKRPVVKQRSTSPASKQENMSWRVTDQFKSAELSKRDRSFHYRKPITKPSKIRTQSREVRAVPRTSPWRF